MSADITDYWVTFDVKANAAVVDAQLADPGNDFFFFYGMANIGHFGSNLFNASLGLSVSLTFDPITHSYTVGPGLQWTLQGPDSLGVQYLGSDYVVAGAWYTVELRVAYDLGANTFNPELFIGGTDQAAATGISNGADMDGTGDNYMLFGSDVTDGEDGYATDFRNIKIGTTRGGSDIFDGSALSSTVIPPFSGEIGGSGDTPSAALSASGGVLTAIQNYTTRPSASDYAYHNASTFGEGGGGSGLHVWQRF